PERRKRLRRVLDRFHFEPGHGQGNLDRRDIGVGVEVLFQPGKGEFHGKSSCAAGKVRAALPPPLRGRVGERGAVEAASRIAASTPSMCCFTSEFQNRKTRYPRLANQASRTRSFI